MKNLSVITEHLKNSYFKNQHIKSYYIPEKWNFANVVFEKNNNRPGEILVNPYNYHIRSIERIIEKHPSIPYTSDIKKSVMYSVFPRSFCSWHHSEDKTKITGGTWLKIISMLPFLKELNIDIIYILPIFKTSKKYMKGSLPSPYSIKNIMQLDDSLHDELLPGISVEQEFNAFIEACHHLGIKVMLDFVFRTASRDSDLLKTHPEWFYYIKNNQKDNFSVPQITSVPHQGVDKTNVDLIYKSEDIKKYIDYFVPAPSNADISSIDINSAENILELFEQKLGITTVPGFADTLNDPQPPWTDVTFLKFYLDNTTVSKKYFDPQSTPLFIAQDGVKNSIFGGNKPNYMLWEYIINVIPYYIEKYGIDGARIDMSHALPKKLSYEIIDKIKEIKDDFILWSEEFDARLSKKALNDGYDFITGGFFYVWKNVNHQYLNKALLKCINSHLPVVSCVENPDSPRAPVTLSDNDLAEASVFITALMPNSIMMINNGQELFERQPMNLGLLNAENGRYVLDEDNPLYGKLPFFDEFYFNWTDEYSEGMIDTIKNAIILRKKYSNIINNDCFNKDLFSQNKVITSILYKKEQNFFAAFINRSLNAKKVPFFEILSNAGIDTNKTKVFFCKRAYQKGFLGPGGIIVFECS